MPTIKIKQGEEEKEIQADEILSLEGYLSINEIEDSYVKKDHFEAEIQRRVNSAKKNTRSELASDDEFLIEQAQSKWGLEFEDGKPKTGPKTDIEKIRENIKKTIYETELDPLKKENQQLRQTTLSNSIIRAATKLGLDPEKMQPVWNNKSLIELKALDQFSWDAETGQWAKKKESGEGYEITSRPDSKYPYVTPEEWLEKMKKTTEYASWFKDLTQKGSGYQGNGAIETKKARNQMSSKEKSEFIAKHGTDAFFKLPLKASEN